MKTKQQQRKKAALARKGLAGKAIPRPQKVSNKALVKDPELRAYELALLDPFDPRAEGARVPDLYTTPTTCFHLRGVQPIYAGPSGSSAFALLPSPLVSAYDTSNAAGSGTNTLLGGSLSQFGNNPTVRYATTSSNLQGIYSAYRTVAAGWKVRVVSPPLNRTGKIIVAPIPTVDEVPGWNTLDLFAGAADAVTASLLGSPSTVALAGPGVLGLPGAKEYSLEELAQNDLILRDRPSSARYFDFHSTNTSTKWATGGATNYSDGVVNASGGTIVGTDRQDPTRMSGHMAYVVIGVGVPASAIYLDVEYVYHLEGVPSLGTSTIVPIPSGASKVVSEPFALDRILAFVSSQPFIEVVQAGLDSFLPAAGAVMRAVRYL